jgi:hypothetical protein
MSAFGVPQLNRRRVERVGIASLNVTVGVVLGSTLVAPYATELPLTVGNSRIPWVSGRYRLFGGRGTFVPGRIISGDGDIIGLPLC